MKSKHRISLLLLLLTITACYESGTWIDDPDNWGRSFRSTKPPDVVVVHSHYWRSPHFTHEFEYFFHIRWNDALKKQLFEANALKPIARKERASFFEDYAGEKPSWFVPKPSERYDVWIYAKEPLAHFRVFIDKDTQDMFLTDYQL